MTKKISLCAVVLLCALSIGVCFAEQVAWNRWRARISVS